MFNSNCSLTWALAVLVSLSVSPEISIVSAKKSKGCKKHSSEATENSSNTGGLGYGLGPNDSIEFMREVPNTQQLTHRLTLPNNYDPMGTPPPLMLFFHGWSGNYETCGDPCFVDAPEKGFVSVSMTGYGDTGWSSWNFAGSSSSPGPDGATCEDGAINYCPDYGESQGCDCSQADNCWWTTCHDSVAQVLSILDEVQDEICIDLDRVWAVGVSNGGMFTFELASDHRSAPRLAGIVPIIGLPHNGYSTGPFVDGLSMFGMFGVSDTVVPPISNTDNPNKTLDTYNSEYYGGGWYYTSLQKVMMDWTKGNGCEGEGQDSLIDDYGVSSYEGLTCTQGCSERKDSTHVVSCLFEGGHESSLDEIWEPTFNFMLAPRKKTKGSGKKLKYPRRVRKGGSKKGVRN